MPPDGRLQAQVVQQRGAERERHLARPRHRVVDDLEALRDVGAAGLGVHARHREQPQLQRGHRLAHLVVQLAREPLPLVFLGGDEPA